MSAVGERKGVHFGGLPFFAELWCPEFGFSIMTPAQAVAAIGKYR
jgi:hypothetical protein